MARVAPTPVVRRLNALPLSVVIPPRIPVPQQHGGFPDLHVAVCLHDQHPEVTAVYDDVGNLTGWRGSYSEVLTGIRTALDGGRREFKSTFDGPPSCAESCRSSRVQVLLTRKFATFYMSRVGSKVDHEHAAGVAAKGTFATSRRLGNVKSSKVRQVDLESRPRCDTHAPVAETASQSFSASSDSGRICPPSTTIV